ncbi:DUF3179 domain-containing (seleno)protein [Halodesulfurarchaeum sp.]|uniref:DUF3179 domain-containing (seleno)protein n=1 Tax=Halodesulfurarchaeum sp. TaxID=1980530 RepID=UPI002FC38A24
MAVTGAVLGLLAVLLSLVAIVSYQWVSLAPRLGIRTLYHLRKIRIAVAVTALMLAVMAKRRADGDSGWVYLGTVLALTPLSGALHASKTLVPLDHPEHVDATEATIDDDSMVIGVEVDGQAHAWLVRTLIPHHIVHDTVSGRPVIAAWCAVCNSGLVFNGIVEGRSLHFDPEAVWRRNMVMRDRETGTLWQHFTGEALVGPLEDSQLDVLGGRLMTWEAWTEDHPGTTLTRDTTADEWEGLFSKDFTREFLLDGAGRDFASRGLGGVTATDDRLGMLTEVIGIEVEGHAKAYPIDRLQERGRVDDEVGGVPVTVTFDSEGNRADVSVAGQSKTFKRTRWLDWFEFHPNTAVYQ